MLACGKLSYCSALSSSLQENRAQRFFCVEFRVQRHPNSIKMPPVLKKTDDNCKCGPRASPRCAFNAGGLQTAVARGRKVEEPCVEQSLLVVKPAVDATLVTEIPHLDLKTKQKIN